jgi:hypothetical protein
MPRLTHVTALASILLLLLCVSSEAANTDSGAVADTIARSLPPLVTITADSTPARADDSPPPTVRAESATWQDWFRTVVGSLIGGAIALAGVWWTRRLATRHEVDRRSERLSNVKAAILCEFQLNHAVLANTIAEIEKMDCSGADEVKARGLARRLLRRDVYDAHLADIADLPRQEAAGIHIVYSSTAWRAEVDSFPGEEAGSKADSRRLADQETLGLLIGMIRLFSGED